MQTRNQKKQQHTNTNKNLKIQESNTEQYITKSELEQIVNSLKMELVKQLNMNKMISKIKQIKEQIDKTINNAGTSTHNNGENVLKQISDQLQEIVNPAFLKNNENPRIVQPDKL